MSLAKTPQYDLPDLRGKRRRKEDKFFRQKSEIQGKLKKEKNLGMQVQLNTRIKQIKGCIEEIEAELSAEQNDE